MGEDADIDRIAKRTRSVTNDIKELANIAAECPTCRRRFEEYLQSKSDNEVNYNHYFLGTSTFSQLSRNGTNIIISMLGRQT